MSSVEPHEEALVHGAINAFVRKPYRTERLLVVVGDNVSQRRGEPRL